MLNKVDKHIKQISQEQIIFLSDFQEVNIVSDKETVLCIKRLAKESGLPVSRVVEALIRAALEEVQVATG